MLSHQFIQSRVEMKLQNILDYELTVIGELGVDLGRVLVPEGRVNLGVHGQALLQGLGQNLVVSGIRLGAFCCTNYY
jgi:hypothetical protein